MRKFYFAILLIVFLSGCTSNDKDCEIVKIEYFIVGGSGTHFPILQTEKETRKTVKNLILDNDKIQDIDTQLKYIEDGESKQTVSLDVVGVFDLFCEKGKKTLVLFSDNNFNLNGKRYSGNIKFAEKLLNLKADSLVFPANWGKDDIKFPN